MNGLIETTITFNSGKFELISYGPNNDIKAASVYKSDTGLPIKKKDADGYYALLELEPVSQ